MSSAGKTSFNLENQRSVVVNILFLESLSAAEIKGRLMKRLSKETLGESPVREWHKRFKNGNWNVKN